MDKQDMSPYMLNRDKESAPDQLPRVCEERGDIYRNSETGASARLMRVRYPTLCNGCDKRIPKNELALGVSRDEEANKSGVWLFGCMECAQVSGYEATTKPGLFKREGD
jgi:hypothetical protein